MRSNPCVMESDCPGVKRKCKRRSPITSELEAARAHNSASNPAPVHVDKPTAPEPEIIDISDSDTETVIVPRPRTPIEVIDTRTALSVFDHVKIPNDILISYLRNFSNGVPDEVPRDITWWCNGHPLQENSRTAEANSFVIMAEKNSVPAQVDGELKQNRDARRMAKHIGDKEFKKDWSSEKEDQYLAQPHPQSEQRRNRNQGRASTWRKKQQSNKTASKQTTTTPDLTQYMSTSSTALRDDPMYNFTQGSRQVFKRKCQNVEHSSFPQLCDATYRQLRGFAPRLQREMPYPIFLHAMNTVLQTWLLDTARNVNQEIRWQDEEQPMSAIPREMIIPTPIAEYLSLINNNIIPNGDTIRINMG
ncbi:hypothetical protein WH47_07709 [Habropoda laboriosa]|uniref:Uncharacterized protein n=1 Tax=Habropoda laboriosa TaxID=597456 RepID=A0A0L7QPZ9_9HYME|nr:hypothetical protein WH47_07709 [Habropoda laboriosa]